jgi:hypothetical protein
VEVQTLNYVMSAALRQATDYADIGLCDALPNKKK